MTNNLKQLKVEELNRYGKSISDIPPEAMKGQGKVIIRIFLKKFGFFGIFPFTFRVLGERRKLLHKYSKEYKELHNRIPKAAREITMMISFFNAVARNETKENAYEFCKSIFEGLAKDAYPALYQMKDLQQCEGDLFENYKKFNIAMFKGSTNDFNVKEIIEEENHLNIIVDKCLNVDAGIMFGCPEIAKLGCDVDKAGYPLIEDGVQSVFRRPCTLAKGGSYCDFHFYRKGFEPEKTYENQ